MDNDFRKLFKIKVEFEDDAPITSENINKLARFIAGYSDFGRKDRCRYCSVWVFDRE